MFVCNPGNLFRPLGFRHPRTAGLSVLVRPDDREVHDNASHRPPVQGAARQRAVPKSKCRSTPAHITGLTAPTRRSANFRSTGLPSALSRSKARCVSNLRRSSGACNRWRCHFGLSATTERDRGFADSLLEGDGFEPSVPVRQTTVSRPAFCHLVRVPIPELTLSRQGTGSSNPSRSSKESANFRSLSGKRIGGVDTRPDRT